MRSLTPEDEPQVLSENREEWQAAFEADRTNKTKKYRYRHTDIKSQAKKETHNKCAYCESGIGHNTPGDIEHKVPTSADVTKHFAWTNLTIACTECNRRKNAYFSTIKPFLDPFVDDVETAVIHYGPMVSWHVGHASAEITVKTLELHNNRRSELILRKVERINELDERLERHQRESDPVMKELLWTEIEAMAAPTSEYSAMIGTILRSQASAINA